MIQVKSDGATVEAASVDPDHDRDPLTLHPGDWSGDGEIQTILTESSVSNPNLNKFLIIERMENMKDVNEMHNCREDLISGAILSK